MVTIRLIFAPMPRASVFCGIAGLIVCLSAVASVSDEISNLKERISQLQEQSKWVEAMPLAETLVSTTARVQGEKSAEMADALHRWAWLVQQNGDYDKAEDLWVRALAIDEGLYGK